MPIYGHFNLKTGYSITGLLDLLMYIWPKMLSFRVRRHFIFTMLSEKVVRLDSAHVIAMEAREKTGNNQCV